MLCAENSYRGRTKDLYPMRALLISPRYLVSSTCFMTSQCVTSLKSPFFVCLSRGVLVPITNKIWRGKVGTHDFGASKSVLMVFVVQLTTQSIRRRNLESVVLVDSDGWRRWGRPRLATDT